MYARLLCMVDSPNGEHALIRNIFTSHTRNFFARPLFVGHEGGARSCECGTSAALKSSNYGVVLVALGGEAGRGVRKMTCKNWGHFPGPSVGQCSPLGHSTIHKRRRRWRGEEGENPSLIPHHRHLVRKQELMFRAPVPPPPLCAHRNCVGPMFSSTSCRATKHE